MPMPAHEQDAYCGRCKRYILARSQEPNHLLHAILSILFCPWLLVWLVVAIKGGTPLRCTRCGTTDLYE